MTEPTQATRGETEFQEAGDGMILLFRNSDLRKLEKEKGMGPGYFNRYIEMAMAGTMTWDEFDLLLKHGLKDADRAPVKVTEAVYESLDAYPVHEFFQKAVDALSVSISGKNLKEHLSELMAAISEAGKSGEALPSLLSPEASSTSSDVDASGPGSA